MCVCPSISMVENEGMDPMSGTATVTQEAGEVPVDGL